MYIHIYYIYIYKFKYIQNPSQQFLKEFPAFGIAENISWNARKFGCPSGAGVKMFDPGHQLWNLPSGKLTYMSKTTMING